MHFTNEFRCFYSLAIGPRRRSIHGQTRVSRREMGEEEDAKTDDIVVNHTTESIASMGPSSHSSLMQPRN